ncbi:MAG: hypothetical protein FD149_1400 [Rhodospirillaceae bacterium]|nr:MAG: hypothetical protein FD149_1400 [Rhodospirillaceae bacterium]
MNDWSAGYVTEIGYTFGYYEELNPLRITLAFLNTGLVPPKVTTACELGFGQGVSLNIHAAASPHTWYANDFNPLHTVFAQEGATASGADVHLSDQTFAEFCGRADVPDFDYIGLHGLWSWVNDENHAIIVDFTRRKLKVGGVVYISHNTLPGWATMVPVRDVLVAYGETMAAHGHGIVSRIESALAFGEKLMGTSPLYARAHSHIVERMAQFKNHDRHYLAHEYFNRDWTPLSFLRLAHQLAPAKIGYACSASYLDHLDALHLSTEQQVLLAEIPDVVLRQSVRDLCTNQQLRRDYWVKGARPATPGAVNEMMRAQRVILVKRRADVSLTVNGILGQATMQESVYDPILDSLADHCPRTLPKNTRGNRGHAGRTSARHHAGASVLGDHGSGGNRSGPTSAGRNGNRGGQTPDRQAEYPYHERLSFRQSPCLSGQSRDGGRRGGEPFPAPVPLARTDGHAQPAQWASFANLDDGGGESG